MGTPTGHPGSRLSWPSEAARLDPKGGNLFMLLEKPR
jgi:hypothetical protein